MRVIKLAKIKKKTLKRIEKQQQEEDEQNKVQVLQRVEEEKMVMEDFDIISDDKQEE